MKLTLKIILLFLVAACGLVGISGYLSVQREVEFFEQHLAEEHSQLAQTVESLLRSENWQSHEFIMAVEKWQKQGNQQQLSMRRVQIRPVILDAGADENEIRRPYASPERIGQPLPGEMVSVIVPQNDGSELYCSYYLASSGVLELSEPLKQRDLYTRDTIIRTIALMAALIGVAVVLVTVVGVELIGRRLEALIDKTRNAADGDLLTPVHVGGRDELTELGSALNQMCEKLDASQKAVVRESAQRLAATEQLRHADRLKTVGRLASGVAHELGTPLNVVNGRAGLIASGKLSPEDVTASAHTIQSESSRMTQIVQQLLNFARRSSPRRTDCDLGTLTEQTARLLEPLARKRNATITISDRSTASVNCRADCGQLQQVISNLIMNALLSKERGAHVTASLSAVSAANPDDAERNQRSCVRLSISDDGAGIDAEDLPHLFEPFFTTRDVGEGTGLGLSIAHGIVTEHGGWIDVESTPEKGSTFHVYLPRDGRAGSEAGE